MSCLRRTLGTKPWYSTGMTGTLHIGSISIFPPYVLRQGLLFQLVIHQTDWPTSPRDTHISASLGLGLDLEVLNTAFEKIAENLNSRTHACTASTLMTKSFFWLLILQILLVIASVSYYTGDLGLSCILQTITMMMFNIYCVHALFKFYQTSKEATYVNLYS